MLYIIVERQLCRLGFLVIYL